MCKDKDSFPHIINEDVWYKYIRCVVFLVGHSKGNRIGIEKRRPAPNTKRKRLVRTLKKRR